MSDDIKTQAFTLTQALKKRGIRLSHGQALDVMVEVHGALSWNHFLAEQKQPQANAPVASAHTSLSPADQSLIDRYETLYNSAPVYSVSEKADVQSPILLEASPSTDTWYVEPVKGVSGGLAVAFLRICLLRARHPEVVKAERRYFSATRVLENGRYVLRNVAPHSLEALMQSSFEVELRAEVPSRRTVQCPVSGLLYSQYSEVVPFGSMMVAKIWNEAFGVHPAFISSEIWATARERVKRPETAKITLSVSEALANYQR